NQDNTLFTSHLTNRPLPALGERSVPQGVIHIERNRLLCDGVLYEQLRLTNFSEESASVPLKLTFAADFADIFEVHGHSRKVHGALLEPQVQPEQVCLAYRGRDDRLRRTVISFSPSPHSLSSEEATYLVRLERGAAAELYLEIGDNRESVPSATRFVAARARA